MFEQQLVWSLLASFFIGNGNALIVFQRPVAIVVLLLTVVIVTMPALVATARRRSARTKPTQTVDS